MVFASFRFPQISRFFSATLLFLTLWVGFGVLFSINSLGFETNSPSKKEVLGVTATESAKLTDQFNYWVSIAEKKSDYRDAFILASSLAYQLGRYEESKKFINHAYTLDPTFPLVLEIQKLLEEN